MERVSGMGLPGRVQSIASSLILDGPSLVLISLLDSSPHLSQVTHTQLYLGCKIQLTALYSAVVFAGTILCRVISIHNKGVGSGLPHAFGWNAS